MGDAAIAAVKLGDDDGNSDSDSNIILLLLLALTLAKRMSLIHTF